MAFSSHKDSSEKKQNTIITGYPLTDHSLTAQSMQEVETVESMKKLMLEKEEQYKKDLSILAQKVDQVKDTDSFIDNLINDLKLQVTTLKGEKDAK